MTFNSFIFLIFFLLVVTIYYLVPAHKRNFVLLTANYLFYVYFDYRLALLLFLVTSITFLIGFKIYSAKQETRKRNYLVLALIINLATLSFFKYFNFFADSLSYIFSLIGFSTNLFTLNILLPLGISFYIFQTLTYLFDIYYGNLTEKFNYFEFSVFASFFPTIVAGPIERASRLLPQIRHRRKLDSKNIKEGFSLIVIGLFRKVLIGDTIGRIINHIFADPQYFTSYEIMVSIILYSIQIYNDFAGYSNIARGVAKILGFDIYINFKQPYFATSVADFWRRWHISLSLWLKDYLFMPLQLKYREYKIWGSVISLLITFTLCGLWHGASWTFVFWGFLHGFYMSFALIFSEQKKIIQNIIENKNLLNLIKLLSTYSLITFAWIFFRAESFENVSLIFHRLLDFSSGEFVLRFTKILITYSIISFLIDYVEIKFATDAFLVKLRPPVRLAISLMVLIFVFAYLITADKAPFIYAQF